MKTKNLGKSSLINWRLLLNCCAGSAALMFFAVSSFAQTPVILTQPQDQAVLPGSMVAFSVALSNAGPFNYQWQFNGTNLANNPITSIAGNGLTALSGDGGQATNAGLNLPSGVAFDASGDLFIADFGHNCIRMINTNGVISTVAGNGGQGFSGDGGQATNANLNLPITVMPVSGVLYIVDYANNRIRKVDTNGIISTIAGNGNADFSGDGGPATSASLYSPTAVALDGFGNLLIADFRNNRIRKVGTNGIITTVAGSGPTGVGVGSYSGDGGPATNATFYNPNGLALDASGNMFISDTLNNRIRKVDTNGVVSTVAGTGTAGFSGDGGPASNATFNNPYWISVDPSGNLFISDCLNNRIREVTTDGNITTIAGNGQTAFAGDGGPATAAGLNDPGVAVALNGRVYIPDFYNNRVRAVNMLGSPTLTLSGVTAANVGGYTVVVSGPSGSVTSSVAQLNLILPPCEPAPSGLVGWWPAEGNANDLVGGNDGSLSNGASFGPGEVGSAFMLDGSGQYVTIADAPALRPASLTVEGWYNFQATDNVRVMVAKPYGPGTWDSFAVWILDGQLEAGMVTTSAAQPWLVYPWSPTLGTWHHVAYTFDETASLQSFYVDGVGVASNSASGPIAYDNHPFQIGADIENGSPAFFFDGSIDEVSLYNRVLTGPEIASIFAAGISGKCETAPIVAVQPQNQIVVVGGTATLSVIAGGAQPMTYQWNFDGTNIADATNSTLILTNASFDMGGSYAVSITNSLGSTISSNAVLTVGSAPAVAISPATDAVVQGTNFTLTANATGTGPLTFQWSQNGAPLSQATNAVLNFTNFQATNVGSYAVFVSSPFGTALSSNAVLTIELLPVLGSQPQSQAVQVGSNLTLTVSVQPPVASGTLQLWLKADAGVIAGTSGLVGQWKDQSGNANDAFQANAHIQPALVYPAGLGGMPAIRFNGIQDGVNGDYLHGIDNVGIPDALTAFCVYNSFTDTNAASIPWLVGVPGVVQGASRCLAILDQELDFGMWSRDYQMPVPFPTNTYRICTDRVNTNLSEVEIFDTTAAATATFNSAISGALTPAAGYYLGGLDPSLTYVSPDNFYGDVAEVIIYKGYLNDSDRLAVQSYLQQKYFQTGGTLADTFQWQFDGTNIDGATNASLTLTNVQPGAVGAYSVIVSDAAGVVTSSNGVLSVGYAPSITNQPVGGEVSQGTNVTFAVDITGTLPVSYQWTVNGAAVPGATNSMLSLTNVQVASSGSYAVTVSNPFGTAVSSNAVLTVVALPVIGDQPQDQSVVVGSNVTFSVGARPASVPSVSSGTLQLWLKADAGVITNSLGQVSQWQDQSGNANNAVQNIANYQPSLVFPTGLGGNAALRFSGSGANINYLQGSGDVGVSGAMTSFTVVNTFTSTNYVPMAWLIGVPARQGASRSETDYQGFRTFTTWSFGYDTPFVVPVNTYRIWSDRINTNLTTLELFDTSAAGSTNFTSAMPTASPVGAGYYVGGLNPAQQTAGWKLDGDISEFIVYKGQLTDADRLTVLNYLQEKYFQGGVTIGDSFQWQFDGTNIAGATNATLTITNVQGTDAGIYTVIVTDPAGSITSSNAVLTALFPAAITTSPVSQSVSAGTTVTFTGAASGTSPLSYQWQLNGTNIAGATNTSFTVTNAVIANDGSYTIVASNPYGMATSSVATLSIDESTIQVVSTSASAASTVVVSINLIALGTESGVGFTLNYDPAVLTYVDTSVGSGASGSGIEVNTNQVASGHLGLGAAEISSTFPAGTNDVFDVTFRTSVVTNTTTTSLTFGNISTGENVSDPTAASLPAIFLPGVVVVSSTPIEGDVWPRTNGDEALSINDWIQEGRFVAGLDTITSASEFERADCAPRSTLGDGEITVADWVQVGRYAVGLDEPTAIGGPIAPAPSTRLSGHPGKDSDSPSVTLVPLTQGAQMNSVSVQLASQGEVNSAGFSVTYNPALVQFVNATLGSDATGAAFIQNTNPATPGTLGFVIGTLAPTTFPAGTASLVTLNFAPVTISNTTAIAFADKPVVRQLSDANAQPLSANFVNSSLAVGGVSWPTLSITPSGNSVSLSWPSSGTPFSLQAASSLDGAWTNVVATPTTNGNSVILTTPVSNDSVYYRLKY